MKLVMVIVNNDDSRNLIDRLSKRRFAVTVTNTLGGFLRVGNTTLFCGVEDAQVAEVIGVIRESCPSRTQYVTPLPPVMEPGEVNIPMPIEKKVGGATIFVLNVDHFEKV
ncbi:MAG: cyclic-di-AMP receptor [Chloroflexota bacterium]|nr:cyclic-di-AMP receptor [Chloroflexota bacterium]